MRRRADMLAELSERRNVFDLIIIGGGANGAGIALDAASRGLRVALFERGDFACGTSSRSSKLIHGGVRYLGLGQWSLVREALSEQAKLLDNAPTLVRPLRFLIPAYSRFAALKFRLGLKCYDWLAAGHDKRASAWLSAAEMLDRARGLSATDLIGGVGYDDAQFDDARLIQTLLARARDHDALTLNYAEVVRIDQTTGGQAETVVVQEHITGQELTVHAKAIVNAAGPYSDVVRRLDNPHAVSNLSPSQGAHIVVPKRFGAGSDALVLPKTADGRIMFSIPWADRVLLGTTDTAMSSPPDCPLALPQEVEAILDTAQMFMNPAPQRSDVSSVFAGLRPLAGTATGAATAKRSREHAIEISPRGLISVTGGKWTTYRLIAEQVVDLALEVLQQARTPSVTATLSLATESACSNASFETWGTAAKHLQALADEDPGLNESLHEDLPDCGAHFVWAARGEYCRSVSDALSFHSRAMFIDAAAAAAIAPRVAKLMATELEQDQRWIDDQIAQARATAKQFSL